MEWRFNRDIDKDKNFLFIICSASDDIIQLVTGFFIIVMIGLSRDNIRVSLSLMFCRKNLLYGKGFFSLIRGADHGKGRPLTVLKLISFILL